MILDIVSTTLYTRDVRVRITYTSNASCLFDLCE